MPSRHERGDTADTERFPPWDTGADDSSATTQRREAVTVAEPYHHSDASLAAPGRSISRTGWWAITLLALALLVAGILLNMVGPARYWTPKPAVFLGYFLISGAIGLVFWKGVRELIASRPTLDTHEPAPLGARAAAAVGAVGVATALILLPGGLATAPPANAFPCPDGTNTCGPQPPTQTPIEPPTQGGQGPTTAIQAPNTTVPPYTGTPTPQTPGPGQSFQGTVQSMPTPDNPNGCIVNCPTQQPPPQTGTGNAPQTGGQNPATGDETQQGEQAPSTADAPVTTAAVPNQATTTPAAPTTTSQQTPHTTGRKRTTRRRRQR